ncbi:MAG: GNAT family N-acetyltransferase [Bacteroidetes bacterium]|nr:GNAT family N-acetyltransferase [Bacteroidota bacterium]
MAKFIFSTVPPKYLQELCGQQGNLFDSLEWQALLEKSFACDILYGWDRKTETGMVVTIFKAGPFRIGYVGFPIGGILGKQSLDGETIMALSKTRFPSALHLLRFPVSAFHDKISLDLESTTIPETAIVDLPRWQLAQIPKLNRYVKKASRLGVNVIDVSDSALQGEICYDLYKKTVQRNYGNLRYNSKYFKSLAELSQIKRNLRFLLAYLDDKLAGFIVVALHGKTAFYLHGAMDVSLRRYGASDRLMYDAIIWAREEGMNCFNLMASPINQPSLIRYKEKWGGVTRSQNNYELQINFLHANLFKGTMWCYNHLNKYFT